MKITSMTVANFLTNCFLLINGQFLYGIAIRLFLMRILFIITVCFLTKVIGLVFAVNNLFVVMI